MAATLEGISESDKGFLTRLERKCHKVREDYSLGKRVTWDCYSNVQLIPEEVERILSIVKNSNNVFLMPIRGRHGFHPAFQVVYFGLDTATKKSEHESLLCFDRFQLPKGYNFPRLRRDFSAKRNLKKARSVGVEFEIGEQSYTH